MRAFPFTLKDSADEWFYYLPKGSIGTWAILQKAFLDKYFPPKKANSLKKAISNIEQERTKTLYEYHERFKRLCSSCPFHGYSTQDLVLHLYNGMLDSERMMVDAACGGNILNKTATAAMDMFKEMAEGSREFGRSAVKHGVSPIDSTSSAMMNEISELKEMVKRLTLKDTPHQLKACGICTDPFHPTDACPQLQEPTAEVNVVGGYAPQKPRYDPYSNTYNPGWKNHPNFRWRDPQEAPQFQQPRPPYQQRPQYQ